MKKTDLRSLSRAELLEMLIQQSEEMEALRSRLEECEQQLENQSLRAREAGSLAEAALQVSGVFEAAQKASDVYFQNIQVLVQEQEECTQKARQLLAETEAQCVAMKAQAQQQCNKLLERAERESLNYWMKVSKKLDSRG